jgi:hypothetical protein
VNLAQNQVYTIEFHVGDQGYSRVGLSLWAREEEEFSRLSNKPCTKTLQEQPKLLQGGQIPFNSAGGKTA